MVYPNEDIQGSNGATINMDIHASALPGGLSRHQNDAAVDDATPRVGPHVEASPNFDRTNSPGSKTAILQKELISQPKDDAQGSSTVLLSIMIQMLDINSDAAQNGNALPRALEEGSPPEVDERDEPYARPYALECGFCKLSFDSRSEKYLNGITGHHYCEKCNMQFRRRGNQLLGHREQSDSHNFCSECEEGFASPSALQTHLRSAAHRPVRFWPCTKCVLGIAVLVLVLSILVPVVALA